MNDSLGDRMKQQYEDRARFMLPRRTWTIIRVDGKAFHTFTRNCDKPYDLKLMEAMDNTAKAMCEEIQGAKFAYVQSDEISVLLTDFAGPQTNAWFDGNVQKMASISAAIATREFNKQRLDQYPFMAAENRGYAMFDARVFSIPDPVEVENYFIWRQQDASRNSVQMAARAQFSHNECENMDCNKLQDMLMTKGINWNNYISGCKRGRGIVKETYMACHAPAPVGYKNEPVERTHWVAMNGLTQNSETPIFTQERGWLRKQIPRMYQE